MKPTDRGVLCVLGVSLLLTGALACTGKADEREPGGGPPGDDRRSGAAPAPARSAPRLAEVLTRVERNAGTETFLEYGDHETIRRLSGADVEWASRFTRLNMIGAPLLVTAGKRLADPTGIDIGQVRIAYSVGRIPRDAGVLSGRFDPSVVDRRLSGLRYRRDRSDPRTWLLEDFGGMGPRHPLARLGVTSWFDAVRITGDAVAYARTTAVLSQVTAAAARPRLDAARSHRAVAGCLGDPIAARIIAPSPRSARPADTGREAGAKPGRGAATVRLAGAGVLAGSPDDVREVLCYQADGDAARLATLAGRLGDTMRGGRSLRAGKPWRQLLAEPRTEILPGGVVRLTARLALGVQAGALLSEVTEFDLPGVASGA